jgi:MFS superfamily sulfate permease-like transporter
MADLTQSRTGLLFPAVLPYEKSWLSADVIAGLTAAAVVIPKALAYASIAGLPVQLGLYTVFVPMVVYALLGTSRVLSVSTSSTIAILTGTQLAAVSRAPRSSSPRFSGSASSRTSSRSPSSSASRPGSGS